MFLVVLKREVVLVNYSIAIIWKINASKLDAMILLLMFVCFFNLNSQQNKIYTVT